MKELNSMIKILNNEKDLKLGFALRKEVFAKEQNVPLEIEIDEKDYLSSTVHIGYYDNEKLVGVARITDLDTNVIHIGRVAIAKIASKSRIRS